MPNKTKLCARIIKEAKNKNRKNISIKFVAVFLIEPFLQQTSKEFCNYSCDEQLTPKIIEAFPTSTD